MNPANFSSAVKNMVQGSIFSAMAGLIADGRQLDRKLVRAIKRSKRNEHYRKCNIERGISPKSFYRHREKQNG